MQKTFVVPGSWPGMVRPGNIDLNDRPVAHNPDGSISTVKSISFGINDHEVLIPQVVDGKVVTPMQALAAYQATGQHLGVFTSPAAANNYANALHLQQAARYLPHS